MPEEEEVKDMAKGDKLGSGWTTLNTKTGKTEDRKADKKKGK